MVGGCREREKRRRGREDHRVLMSAKMRRLVEDALGISHDDSQDQEDDDDDEEDEGEEEEREAWEVEGEAAMVRALVSGMGFSEAQVKRAVRAVRRERGLAGPVSGEEALDWLLLHLREEDLPPAFDPRGKNFDVVRFNGEQQEAAGQQEGGSGSSEYGLRQEDEALLQDMKSPLQWARALGSGLFRHVLKTSGQQEAEEEEEWLSRLLLPEEGGEGSGEGEELEEEVETLRAIVGDEHCTVEQLGGACRRLQVQGVKGLQQASKGNKGKGRALELWLGPGYPQVPAVALVRGRGVVVEQQVALAERAMGLRGHAMLYDLVSAAQELMVAADEEGGKGSRRRRGPCLLAEDKEEEDEEGATTASAVSNEDAITLDGSSTTTTNGSGGGKVCFLNR